METILAKINTLGSFELNLLSAAVFGLLVWLTRLSIKRATKSGKAFMDAYSEAWLQKYYAHQQIFNAEEIAVPLRTFFFVILTSVAWFLRGAMVLIFVYGAAALVDGRWLLTIGHWFAFNFLLEGFLWAKDSRNDETPKAIYEAKMRTTQDTSESA